MDARGYIWHSANSQTFGHSKQPSQQCHLYKAATQLFRTEFPTELEICCALRWKRTADSWAWANATVHSWNLLNNIEMCYACIRYNLFDNSANRCTIAIARIQFQFLHFCLLHCLSSLPEGAQIPTLNTSLSPQPGPPQCHLFDGCLGQKSRQGSATGKTVERKMPRKKTTKASTSSTDIVLQCFTCVQFTL